MANRRLRRAALPLAALACALAVPATASATPTPPVVPHVLAAPAPATTSPHAPISIGLLGITVSVDVPLPGGPVQPPPPRTSSHRPPTSTVPVPPLTRNTTTPAPPRPSPNRTSSQVIAGPVVPSTSTVPPRHRPSTPVQQPQHRTVIQEAGSFLLKLVPTSIAGLMLLLTFLGALGMVVWVYRMGRRAEHA